MLTNQEFHDQLNPNEIIKNSKKLKEDYGINLYDKVLELRKFEIENFLEEKFIFWGTIALIYLVYFRSNSQAYNIIIVLVGICFNFIFVLSVRGSKYWQEHWEAIAVHFEEELRFELFQYDTKDAIFEKEKSFFTKPHRFSVSKLAMLLSDISLITFAFLWLREVYLLINKHQLKFDFSMQSTIHLYTFAICSFHLIIASYILYMLKTGGIYKKRKLKEKKDE